jgi:hypothetical protein
LEVNVLKGIDLTEKFYNISEYFVGDGKTWQQVALF